jgi:hypothetical protein
MPAWIGIVAVASLVVALGCAAVILVDVVLHPQHMAVMNVVWPVTALYLGPIALWGYFTAGRSSTEDAVRSAERAGQPMPGKRRPTWQATALAATHCGAGCTLGDLAAESFVVLVPLTLFGHRIFGTWVLDYALAFVLGIAFQYFTIAPMKGLSPGEGLVAALKADTLSLTAWQVGMYGWMALVVFVLVGHELSKSSPSFWFMMQIAMVAGLFTSYPVNRWLLARGIKERM